jgi:hypothetical protein
VHEILDESDAIQTALDAARDGDLVVLQVDNIRRAIQRVRAKQARGARAGPQDAAASAATAPRA